MQFNRRHYKRSPNRATRTTDDSCSASIDGHAFARALCHLRAGAPEKFFTEEFNSDPGANWGFFVLRGNKTSDRSKATT